MLTIDFETKSYADLTQVGVWAYSEDPTTEIICACWKIDDEPIQEWWPGKNKNDAMPNDLYIHVHLHKEIEAHNVAFERSIWENVLFPQYGWSKPLVETWRDTMAVACYYAMPAGLDKLARACGFSGKDPEGVRLITKYSKLYLKTAREIIPPEDFDKFVNYCRQDVILEAAVSDWLGDLPDDELETFLLDQKINLRGLYLDQDGIDDATAIVDQRETELIAKFRKLTGINPSQRKEVLLWFQTQGVYLANLQADYLNDLFDDIPFGPARTAMDIRLEISKASTKKLDAMTRQRGSDGTAKFQLRYHATQTGRWAGQGFHPLNLSRGFENVDPEALVRDIGYRSARWLDLLYGSALDAVGKASRHWIRAHKGNKLIAGDFVSIEAVILACQAGETWKIDAFRRGDKLYELMGDMIYGLEPGTVTKATHPIERHDGKTGELAFGFGGAVGAWRRFDKSDRHDDEAVVSFCRAWRARHPEIVDDWYQTGVAAIEAVRDKKIVTFGHFSFEPIDEWLAMTLASGKRIWYFAPKLEQRMTRRHKPELNEDCRDGTCSCRLETVLTYMSVKTGQWKRIGTYGAKLVENRVQATAREVLVPSMKRAEKYGYHVILNMYDEIVSEVPIGFGSVKEFNELIEPQEDWCSDWPIRAETWEGDRFRK